MIKLPFVVGDIIHIDGKDREVVAIDLVSSMGEIGWVKFAHSEKEIWFCIDYVIKVIKQQKHKDTPLYKKLLGNDDGFVPDLRYLSGICGILSLYSLYHNSLRYYVLCATICILAFGLHHLTKE